MTTEVLLVLVLGAVVLLLGLSLVLQRGLMRELRSALTEARREAQDGARESRTELTSTLNQFSQTLQQQMGSNTTTQNSRIDGFSSQLAMLIKSNEERLAEVRNVLENKLRELQQDNATRLEEMRKTVDERLQTTLEKRLGESFSQVSQHLEQVLKGLGEMNTLAAGVGDLKRVLTNVRSRGTWGEVQLGNLLEQTLTAEQYAKNVATRPGSRERVEYAIRLPGQDSAHVVWLPVDAKFPVEDYERLLAAQERADAPGMEEAGRALENRIRLEAKTIREKYVEVPHTTDFAILFLPTEGLYAEVLRRPGLMDTLQRDYRVTLAGPTTLLAMLNSLQMGFKTLAIQKRSSEVWQILGAVKTEFTKFGTVLEKARKKISEADGELEKLVTTRTNQLMSKLKKVEELPSSESAKLLEGPIETFEDDSEEV